MYIYKRSEPRLWTVGFYEPNGKFVPESDHDIEENAARRTHYMNGGRDNKLVEALEAIREADKKGIIADHVEFWQKRMTAKEVVDCVLS